MNFLLNDLEISLQLGKYEFGAAKPTDNRSRQFPFSNLTLHEKSLVEYNRQVVTRENRAKTAPLQSVGTNSLELSSPAESKPIAVTRPQSAFNIEKPRHESRLYQALIKRAKTAPTSITANQTSTANYRSRRPKTCGLGEPHDQPPQIVVPDTVSSSGSSSPRTFRSVGRDGAASRESRKTVASSAKASVLERYNTVYTSQRESHDEKADKRPTNSAKSHKCQTLGPHTIHRNMKSTTIGPNSTIRSVVGYIRPSKTTEPIHKSAWYHVPNHYTTVSKPHISSRVYAERKNRLMQQRSQSTPVKSRYLQDHTHAISRIAAYEHMPINTLNY